MLVKFHRPVGGALMQCFKAWERTGQQSRAEERRKGWEKMLRQAQQTSPSTRKKVKQSGDKCRSEKLILVELIPKFHHFERCFGSFSVFRKSCDAHMMLVFGFIRLGSTHVANCVTYTIT